MPPVTCEIVSYATFLEYRAGRLRAPVVAGVVLEPDPEIAAGKPRRTLAGEPEPLPPRG